MHVECLGRLRIVHNMTISQILEHLLVESFYNVFFHNVVDHSQRVNGALEPKNWRSVAR